MNMNPKKILNCGGSMISVEKLTDEFKTELHDRAKDIDPDNEHEWGTLAYGWALANGLSPKDALEFAEYIRYHTDLG